MAQLEDQFAGKKVLITGASGFIGSRLRAELLAQSADVIAIRRPGSPPAKEGRSVTASYADQDALDKVMQDEQPNVVLHVAGVTKGVTYSDFQSGNVMPTRNLLQAIQTHHQNIERFVHVSSLTSYGPAKVGAPLDEASARRPIEFYGQSKLEAEHVVESFSDIPWTIMRPSGVFGPGDVDYFELFKSVRKGINAYFGNRHRWFSSLYVDDCVRGILEGALHEKTVGEGYFLSDGKPQTWGAFQERVVEEINPKARTLNLPEAIMTVAAFGGELLTKVDGKARLLNKQKAKMAAQEAWTCTDDKARNDFGFECKVEVKDGIRRTDAWYAQEGWY